MYLAGCRVVVGLDGQLGGGLLGMCMGLDAGLDTGLGARLGGELIRLYTGLGLTLSLIRGVSVSCQVCIRS